MYTSACKPQFYYIKVGFKEVKIIKVCFRDDCIYPMYSNRQVLAKSVHQKKMPQNVTGLWSESILFAMQPSLF